MFWYLDNRNEKWKTSGIKDEDICEVNFTPSVATEIERVRCDIERTRVIYLSRWFRRSFPAVYALELWHKTLSFLSP